MPRGGKTGGDLRSYRRLPRRMMRALDNKESAVTNQTFDVLTSVFNKMLPSLKGIIAKAEADAEARKIDPQVFLQGRLAPDMLPLTVQIQIVTDNVKGAMARLGGADVPRWEDNEKSFAELRARLDKTIDYVKTFKPEQFQGAESRSIELKFPNATLNFTGRDYLYDFVIPNFYFHATTAYAILRHNGVPLGKRDYLGG